MAKQLVNPIERHLEKGILGLAGMILIVAIARYLVTTPNQLELGGERSTPGNIDAKVAEKAREVAGRLRSAPPKATTPDALFAEFAGSLKPVEASPLPLAVALGPEVPLLDKAGPTAGQAALVAVQQPAKPIVSQGRATLVLTSPSGSPQNIATDWSTVSAVFDIRAQRELLRREYGPLHDELVFGPPQLQRRMRRPDGSWSDQDWADVAAWPGIKPPKEPAVPLLDEGGKLVVDKETLKVLDNYVTELRRMQLDIIRPMPPEMARPTRWILPVITSYRDVLKQDDEYLFPNEAPAADPADRYGLSGEPVKKRPESEHLTPAQMIARTLQEGQQLLESAKTTRAVNEAIKAQNKAADVILDRTATPADKDKADKLKKDAEQVERDIRRAELAGKPVQPTGPAGQAAPAVSKRPERLPTQQLWLHDAAVDSLKNGATYQYRSRFRIFNVLAGAPAKFNNPHDAAVVLSPSEWSEPSDPVNIERSSQFFVTGENPKNQEISVEFFQWFAGVWVKPTSRIKAAIGQSLRDKQRIDAPRIDDPTQLDKPEVEFAADAAVVDVDFERAVRERKVGTPPKGVKFAAAPPSTSVVLVDSEGRLQERFVLLDKNHPEKRELTERLWRPKAKQP